MAGPSPEPQRHEEQQAPDRTLEWRKSTPTWHDDPLAKAWRLLRTRANPRPTR